MINKIKTAIQNDNDDDDFESEIYDNYRDLNWLQQLTPKSIYVFWDVLVGRKYSYFDQEYMFSVQANIWQSLSINQLNILCDTEDYYAHITNFIQKNCECGTGFNQINYIDTEQCNLDKYVGCPITSQEVKSYPFYKIDHFWDNDFENKWSSLNENAKKLLFRYAIKQLFIVWNNVANQKDSTESFKSLSGLLNSISFLIKKYNVDDVLSAYTNIFAIYKLAQNAFFSDNLEVDDKNKVLECLNTLAEFKQLGTKFQDNIKKMIEMLRLDSQIGQNVGFEFYLKVIENLDSDGIIAEFDKNWFKECQICAQVLENLSSQQINNLVAYKSDDKNGTNFIDELLKTVCHSKRIYDKYSGEFLRFDKTAGNSFFGAQQIKRSVSILVDAVENNIQALSLKTEEKHVTEYKLFSEEKFKGLSPEAKNLFVSTLLNSFLEDLTRKDDIYMSDNKKKCLAPDQMLAAMNECYINFSEVLKSFRETDKGCIKIDVNVLEKLIFQLFARDESGYLKPFLIKLIELPGLDKSFVDYVKNILPFCDINLLGGNCAYADIVNVAVANKNKNQIDFIRKLMKYKYFYFFQYEEHNFIEKLTYDSIITFGEFINIRAINCLNKDYIKTVFEDMEYRKILEKALKSEDSEFTISFNKLFGHNTKELEVLADYEFMEFGNPESAKELPAWLLKIKENDNLQSDNFPQFTFKSLIVPDNNVDSVFIAHDVNVRINKLLKELLDDVKNNNNNQENTEKFIDTEKMREVFVNVYCLIRKHTKHNLKIRIDKEIINSIVGKTKKEDLKYLATCFNNFSSFSSFGQLTQKKFEEARKKYLDLMDFNSNEFLQRLEFDREFASKVFLSNSIQKLSVQSLIAKKHILQTRPDCIFYLSNQQINDLAGQEGGLKLIKGFIVDCQRSTSKAKIFESEDQTVQISGRNRSISRFSHIEEKLAGINLLSIKKIFVEETVKYLLIKLGKSISIHIGTDQLFDTIFGLRDQPDTVPCITKTFDSIYVLMQNTAVTNDLNIEINYFVLDALTDKISTAERQFYSQQLQRIIELPSFGAKTLYYLKQAINFLSFGYFCNENSLMAKVRNMREQNINPQNPVPQMENDDLNIQ